MVLGVQNMVRYAALFQQFGEPLRILDGNRSDQDRLSGLVALLDVFDDRMEFFLFRLVDDISLVDTDHRLVGRDDHHVELVYLAELGRFCVGRTGHAGKFFIHAEIVLEGDRRQGLVLALNFQAFFCLDGLMLSIAPTPARHEPTGKFVNDDHFTVFDHIINITLENRMRPERLVDMVEDGHIARLV